MNLSHSSGSGSILPGRGLMNPAFVIKIVPATDDMQQKPDSGRNNPDNNYLDNLKTGSLVSAKVGKRTIKGKVDRVIKNDLGDCVFVVIKDDKGKMHKIDSTRIDKKFNNPIDDEQGRLASSPALLNESRFLSFSEFSK